MTTERRVEETGTASFPASGSSPYTSTPWPMDTPIRTLSAPPFVSSSNTADTVWFRAASKSLPVRELSVRLRSLLCSRVV